MMNRWGRRYKENPGSMAEEDAVGGVIMVEMVWLLLEDRCARDDELKEERWRR